MTLAEIAESPADALATRLDRAREAFAHLDENAAADKWAVCEGKLYVESSDGRTAWTTDGVTCDCPDATVGTGARFLNGTCKHVALHYLISHQRAVRNLEPLNVPLRPDELTDADVALLVVPVSADPLFLDPAPRRRTTRSAAELLATL